MLQNFFKFGRIKEIKEERKASLKEKHMTSNELKAKFEASQEKVEKRVGTIAKVCKGLKVNHNDLLEEYRKVVVGKTTLTRMDAKSIVSKFVEEKPTRDANGNWDDDAYDFNWKVDQLRDNLDKLFDLETICKNWEVKYNTQLTKENAPKIEILWDFLTRWENNAREWYKRNSKLYYDLYTNEDKEWETYKTTKEYQEEMDYIQYLYPNNQKWAIEYKVERRWKERYYEDINMFTKDITSGSKEHRIDMERLNKFLAQEKVHKYEDLCNRITSVVGEILDVSNLSIGEKQGELNGIVVGSKAKAKVETIGAGGWNIQCFHYRVLVNKVKA